MNRVPSRFLVSLILAVLRIVASITPARADDSLKTINNPGGGQIIYGPLSDESTMQGAMRTMLHNIHGHFGDRPQIGKFFQTPARDSVATFFTLTAANQGGKRIAGLVIVSMPRDAKPAAAVLYDDASRFSKTLNPMMGRLNEAWHRDAARSAPPPQSPSAHGHEGVAQPLHQTRFSDNSGSIGLPTGWQITGAGGGTVHVAGPHGEELHLGVIFQGIYDPRNPRTRGMIDYLNKARQPYYIYPYGDDLVKSWLAVLQQGHQRDHTPTPSFRVTSGQNAQPNPYETAAVLVQGDFDAHDARGTLISSVRLGAMRPTGGAQWALTLNRESVPKQLADEEWPTIVAMVNSYRQNGAEIQRQTNIIIQNINANAAAARARAAATSDANDRHNADVEARWDDNAKYNKSFENYQLDRTVIQDNERNERGTTGYQYGDELVRSDPNRFQYVPTQDFLKGVDY